MAAPERLTIGFKGGQSLPVRADAKAADALRKALEKGGGWHELAAEDGPVLLDLAQVVYLRTDADEQRVGFGS